MTQKLSWDELNAWLAESEREFQNTLELLKANGIEFVFEEANWLTIRRYAEKYDMGVEMLTDWIQQGRIPVDDVEVIDMEKGFIAIKDKLYV